MADILPEPPYYTIKQLSKRWECEEADVLHYGRTGQLKISVFSASWLLEEGYFTDDDGEGYWPVPVKDRWSDREPLVLSCASIKEVIDTGEVQNPSLAAEEGRYLSTARQTQDSQSYEIIILVKQNDLVITNEDLKTFEAGGVMQKEETSRVYDFSTIKPKLRKPIILDYAIKVREEYIQQNGSIPKMEYVKQKIKDNPNFTYSTGRPSKNTIIRLISEEKILLEIQSRKNAQKCAKNTL